MYFISDKILEEKNFKKKQIVVYGTGSVGRAVLKRLLFLKMHVHAVVVTKRRDKSASLLGIPIFEINELTMDTKNCVVIVAASEEKQSEIIKILNKNGFSNIYLISDKLYSEWNKMFARSSDKKTYEMNYFCRYIEPYLDSFDYWYKRQETRTAKTTKALLQNINDFESKCICFPRLVVSLGTKCNLCCKECNNLMHHFIPQKDLKEEVVLQSLNNIVKSGTIIIRCELIGGEPFLSCNLMPVLRYVIQHHNFVSVEITTNGTVIPSEEMIELLKNKKIIVRISDYGKSFEKKIITLLEENNIQYEVLDLGQWVSPGSIENRGRNKDELRKIYTKCTSGYICKTLYNGKIYACARAASLHSLGYMSENEYVNILEGFNAVEVKEFLLQDYSMACNYCDIECDNKIFVEPAQQIDMAEMHRKRKQK